MKKKNQSSVSEADQKKLAEQLDITFAAAAEALSLKTELIEYCEWDEEQASNIIKDFSDTIENLAEYGKYDDSFEYKDFEHLIKLNMKSQTSDEQFKILMKLLKSEATEQIKSSLLNKKTDN